MSRGCQAAALQRREGLSPGRTGAELCQDSRQSSHSVPGVEGIEGRMTNPGDWLILEVPQRDDPRSSRCS